MHKRTALSIILLATAVLCQFACSSGAAPSPPKQSAPTAAQASNSGATIHTITISGFKYQPAELTIKVGDTVVWKNLDSMPHNAVANDKSFDFGKLKTGETGKFTADANSKGTHDYICTYHPNMKA